MSVARSIWRSTPAIKRPRKLQPAIIPTDKLARLSNYDYSKFIAESASLDTLRAIGLDNLVDDMSRRTALFTHKDVFRITGKLSSLNVLCSNPKLFGLIADCIMDDGRINQFQVHEIATMCIEMSSNLRRTPAPGIRIEAVNLVARLADSFKRKIGAASHIDLTNMTVAMADLGIVDADLLQGIETAASLQIGLFKGPDLSDMLLSFCVLGYKPDILLEKAIKRLGERMRNLYTPQLLHTAFVLARFDITHNKHLIDSLCEELESRNDVDLITHEWKDFDVSRSKLGISESQIPKTWKIIQSKQAVFDNTPIH
jgi:hypothetical protein